jgi:hypothetical protein
VKWFVNVLPLHDVNEMTVVCPTAIENEIGTIGDFLLHDWESSVKFA